MSKNLRSQYLRLRDQLSLAQRREKSAAIFRTLCEQPVFQAAEHLFLYMNFRSEVETCEILHCCLAAGKKVSVPLTLVQEARLLAVQITDPEPQIQAGYCGIPEPSPAQLAHAQSKPEEIDLVLLPGAVFDPLGARLGYGGGFYDRFLSEAAPQAFRIALAYALQVIEELTTQPHDQYMDMIITEQQVYLCSRRPHAHYRNLPKYTLPPT
jgi:5-formyltetrahydrofolate cyclo-ligase